MKTKQNILFDLDGTLTDPKEGITKCIQYALDFFGVHVEDLDSLCRFIGPPLAPAFQEVYGFSKETAEAALAKYRERFGTVGLFENELYAGISEVLADLKKAGYRLFLATSKPTVYAVQILEHFKLDGYFEFVGGAEIGGKRIHKPDVIEYVLAENNLNRADCVMIGDRKYDMEGGKGASLATLGVLYGYGDREELTAAGADVICETVEDLRKIFL